MKIKAWFQFSLGTSFMSLSNFKIATPYSPLQNMNLSRSATSSPEPENNNSDVKKGTSGSRFPPKMTS